MYFGRIHYLLLLQFELFKNIPFSLPYLSIFPRFSHTIMTLSSRHVGHGMRISASLARSTACLDWSHRRYHSNHWTPANGALWAAWEANRRRCACPPLVPLVPYMSGVCLFKSPVLLSALPCPYFLVKPLASVRFRLSIVLPGCTLAQNSVCAMHSYTDTMTSSLISSRRMAQKYSAADPLLRFFVHKSFPFASLYHLYLPRNYATILPSCAYDYVLLAICMA